MSSVISTSDLRKSFRSRGTTVEAVSGVTIEVRQGQIFGFLGPNGAGKTTTMRMITTLLPIGGGTARVAGLDVGRQPKAVRARIGYVSQAGGADELATGRENLLLQGRLYGGRPRSVATRADEVMRLLDLADFADRKVNTYSGGQRRRLDIGLGIVHRPEVLFLDEPSTGLDPQNRANLWDHVRALRDAGSTVFLTTHYLDEADALRDTIVIMDHGVVVVDGSPHELKKQVAGESVILALRGDDVADTPAIALLAQEPYVRQVAEDGGQVRLYVNDAGEALPRILRLLDTAGIGVKSVSMSEPTLDDVFLRQTGRSLRDATATSEGGPR